jgi:RNA polymerase sigma-70 factor (ECF subfamily)
MDKPLSPADPTAPALDFEAVNAPDFLGRLREPGAAGRRAFGQLVRATHAPFLGFIRRQLASPEECQEVLQETYLAVHKGLAGFKGESKLTTWMFSLAHHKICDRIADRHRSHQELTEERMAALSTEGADGGLAGATAWDAPPDRLSARNAVEALIGKAIEALPEQARRIYHLRDVEGLSGEEAASVTGMTPENVRVQLHRARRKIVEWVQEKMAGAGAAPGPGAAA